MFPSLNTAEILMPFPSFPLQCACLQCSVCYITLLFLFACLPFCHGAFLWGENQTSEGYTHDAEHSGTHRVPAQPSFLACVGGWMDALTPHRDRRSELSYVLTESNCTELSQNKLLWVCTHVFKVPWAKIKEFIPPDEQRTNSAKSLWPLRFCFLQK